MNQRNLDFIRREKPPWARMLSMTKTKMVRAGIDQLCRVFLARNLSPVVKAIPIPSTRILVRLFIPHAVCRDSKIRALGDDGSVGECNLGCGHTTHRGNTDGLETLAFFDDAVEELHVVERCLGPAVTGKNRLGFLAEGVDHPWVLSEIGHDLTEKISGGVDGGHGEDELSVDRAVVASVGGLFEPFDGVVVFYIGVLACGSLFPATLFEDGRDDTMSFANVGAGFFAFRNKPVGNWLKDGRPEAELLDGAAHVASVFTGDLEPGFVAADLVAQEYTRGNACHQRKKGLANVDGVPFPVLSKGFGKSEGSLFCEGLGDLVWL